jgi:hypothetical protein
MATESQGSDVYTNLGNVMIMDRLVVCSAVPLE